MAEQETQNILTAQELPIEEQSEQSNPLAFLDEKPKKKLSKGERKKLRVIKKLLLGEINGTEAAKKLGITTRQVRNLKRQVLNEGTEGNHIILMIQK